MLYRSISVALIVLLSWFAYTSIQSSQYIDARLGQLQQHTAQNLTPLVDAQQKMAEQIGQIEGFISQQKQVVLAKKKVEAKLLKQTQQVALYITYANVLKADVLRGKKHFSKAADLLKSTKKEIWKTGDLYPKHQKTLRGLMQKVDALVNAWKAKDGSKHADVIYMALEKVLQEKR